MKNKPAIPAPKMGPLGLPESDYDYNKRKLIEAGVYNPGPIFTPIKKKI